MSRAKGWLWPALFVVGLGAALIISGLAGNTGPNGLPLIKSGDEYNSTLEKANAILKEEIGKSDQGQPLTDADKAKLHEASKLYDMLNVFNPTKMGPYFASGRVHLMLGENEQAAHDLRQAVDNSVQEGSAPADKVRLLTADAEYYLAIAYENMDDFINAMPAINLAIKQFGDRSDYRFVRARALIQLKKIPEATTDLETAVQLDPTDQKAISLLKFVRSASH
jgi:tetratricopeptide (TPR) repeat protein